MVDMTDMDGCKRYHSDKEDCKEFEALEIGNMDGTDSYRWKCYLDSEAGSVVWRSFHQYADYTCQTRPLSDLPRPP